MKNNMNKVSMKTEKRIQSVKDAKTEKKKMD